jgi:peptidyl-tRNA hydrolase, PTH1 family
MQNKQPILYNASTIRAIIGLGNPGQKYYKTRHNIGYRIIDKLASKFCLVWHSSAIMELTTTGQDAFSQAGALVHLIKPTTFMNNSGKVIPFLQKKGIKGDHLVIIHDELEKPFGKVSLKFGGSAKGHNGLRSMINVVGKDFWRLRFGIGRPEDRDQVGNYVLRLFLQGEEQELDKYIDQAIQLLLG